MKKMTPILLFFLLIFPALVYGGGPKDTIEGAVGQIMEILKDPQYREAALKGGQRERIWEIIQRIFDFEEMAKRSLGANRKKFTPPQLKEFSRLFGELIGTDYLRKIQKGFTNEKVAFLNQEMLSDSKAVVHTKIHRATDDVTVDYSMIKTADAWKAYNVKIMGISMVRNWQKQFNSSLRRGTPDKLIGQLKKKIAQQRAKES